MKGSVTVARMQSPLLQGMFLPGLNIRNPGSTKDLQAGDRCCFPLGTGYQEAQG